MNRKDQSEIGRRTGKASQEERKKNIAHRHWSPSVIQAAAPQQHSMCIAPQLLHPAFMPPGVITHPPVRIRTHAPPPPEPEACFPAHCRRGIGGVVRAVIGVLELGVVVGGVSGGRDAAVLGLGTGGGGGDAARGLGGDVGGGEVDEEEDLPPSPRAQAGNRRWGEARGRQPVRGRRCRVVLPIPGLGIVEGARKRRIEIEC
ncbi:hypothetical protein B0H13DRAFT_1870121 [Mycena leptocephala]|nr:hypothetical protein B0H13DRAFT_1870121 [Mycena leptocephala]